MGTRHYINIYKGKTKIVSNYGQWDGYLTGQGQDIQDFLKDESNVRDLIDRAKKFRNKKMKSPYNKDVALESQYYSDSDVKMVIDTYHATRALPPEFSRDTGSKILGLFLKYDQKFRKPESTKDYNEGISWCEYIYDIHPAKKIIRVTDLYAKKTLEFTFDEYIKLDLSKVSFKSKKLKAV